MKFKSDIEVQAGIKDSTGSLGTSGQVLLSGGSSVAWTSLAPGGVTSFNTRTGVITLTSGDVTTALGYTPTNVTIGTANGLSLSTQALSLGLASTSANGALSSTDWNAFNGKQNQLNGTGFVKASGTTISYDNTSYLPLSGGTMTGNLFLRDNNTVGGTNYYIGQTMATNDNWKIYGNSIALDYGEMVFEIGDNAITDGQRFRFFYNETGGGEGASKSPFILNYNDATFNTNATISGSLGVGVTSTSFKLEVNGTGRYTLGTGETIDFSLPGGSTGIIYNNASTNNYSRFNTYNNPSATSANRFFAMEWDDTGLGLRIMKSGIVGISNTSPNLSSSAANQLVVGNGSGNTGITILSGTTGFSSLHFSDGQGGAADYVGYINYNHTTNVMNFGTNSTAKAQLNSGGNFSANGLSISNTLSNQQLSFIKNGSLRYAVGTEVGAGSTNDWSIYSYVFGGTSMIIYANNNWQFFGVPISDVRSKEKIEDLDFNYTEKIIALKPKSYYMKNDSKKLRYGFIAQEVNEVLPDLINGDIKGKDYIGLDYNGIIPVLVGAIKELTARLEILENK